MSKIHHYHLLITIMRILLILAVGGIVLALILLPTFFQPTLTPSSSLASQKIGSVKNTLRHAKYCSTYNTNPYCINAQEAHNISDQKVALTSLDSTLHHDGRDISVSSRTGLYDQTHNRLHLNEEVTLTTSDGYTLNTSNAQVDLENQKIEGTHKIAGEGPLGSLEASQFEFLQKEEKIILKGPSTLVITGKKTS